MTFTVYFRPGCSFIFVDVQNERLIAAQERWQEWFEEMEQHMRLESKKGHSYGDELVSIRQVRY